MVLHTQNPHPLCATGDTPRLNHRNVRHGNTAKRARAKRPPYTTTFRTRKSVWGGRNVPDNPHWRRHGEGKRTAPHLEKVSDGKL